MTRYQVAAVLTAVGVVAGTVGGFLISAAVGCFVLAGLCLSVAVLLSIEAPAVEESEE